MADGLLLFEGADDRCDGRPGPLASVGPVCRRPTLPSRGIDSAVDGPSWTCAHRYAVAQVVTNLLANSERPAPGSRVVVRGRRSAGQVVVEVQDDGPGVAPGTETRAPGEGRGRRPDGRLGTGAARVPTPRHRAERRAARAAHAGARVPGALHAARRRASCPAHTPGPTGAEGGIVSERAPSVLIVDDHALVSTTPLEAQPRACAVRGEPIRLARPERVSRLHGRLTA
jgi:hypothetical protein